MINDDIINSLTYNLNLYKSDVQMYLDGNKTIDEIYNIFEEISGKINFNWNTKEKLVKYINNFGKDEFFERCIVMSIFGNGYKLNLYNALFKIDCNIEKGIKELFNILDKNKVSIYYQCNLVCNIYDGLYYDDDTKKKYMEALKKVFYKYLEDREEETLNVFKNSHILGRDFGIICMKQNPERYKKQLLEAFSDSSKNVRHDLVEIISELPQWEEDVLSKLNSKKSNDRECAIRILNKWSNTKYNENFKKLLETEKNKNIIDLLNSVLNINNKTIDKNGVTTDDYIKDMLKGGRKKAISWIYDRQLPIVHTKNGEQVSEDYMQAILISYFSMKVTELGINKEVCILTDILDEKELENYMCEVFDIWIEKGAVAKQRWILYVTSIYGGTKIVDKLKHNINEWSKSARGAIASVAVNALALNPSPTALLVVDSISRKFKHKQVREAAGQALVFAAGQMGITVDELSDKIVPDLGFNENMERIFDYGSRKFKVYISPTLEIEIYDENEKKLKNIPSPAKKDDEQKAKTAYEEFKQMKKQIKTIVSVQKARLETALSVERKWSIENWNNLFVKNPIMHQFAISLIWGFYENENLIETFRYMEDGSFNTEDEEEFQMPQQGKIGLVHPIELSKQSIENWHQQLEDYEITQSIEQLDREVFKVMEEEKNQKSLERFGGYIMNGLTLSGKLIPNNWVRGSILDAGSFFNFYYEDKKLQIGVELNFSGMSVGYENEDITIYDVNFYKVGAIQKDYKIQNSDLLYLSDIPERYFSEVIYQLKKALSSSKGKNENWKNNKI